MAQTTWRKNRAGKWEKTEAQPYAGDYTETTNADGSTTRSPILTQDNYSEARNPGEQPPAGPRSQDMTPREFHRTRMAQTRSVNDAARVENLRRREDAYQRGKESGQIVAEPTPNASKADTENYVRRINDQVSGAGQRRRNQTAVDMASAHAHRQQQVAEAYRSNPKVQAAIAKRDAAEAASKPQSTEERMLGIAKELKPGNFVSVRNGGETTIASKKVNVPLTEKAGSTAAATTVFNTTPVNERAMAKTTTGEWKPIADAAPEYKPIAAAQDRAAQNAAESAAFMRAFKEGKIPERKPDPFKRTASNEKQTRRTI